MYRVCAPWRGRHSHEKLIEYYMLNDVAPDGNEIAGYFSGMIHPQPV